jgi:ribonuclease HI
MNVLHILKGYDKYESQKTMSHAKKPSKISTIKQGGSNDDKNYLLQFDGGSNPNPGPCAGAFVIYDYNSNNDGQKNIVAEGGCFIGDGTNNIGEYSGLRCGLEKCRALGIRNIDIEGDSLLVISQITGQWKVKNQILAIIYNEIMMMFNDFDNISAKHIYREHNSYADSLSDKTLLLKRNW